MADHLWPEGTSGILSGLANIRFYDAATLALLSRKIQTDCKTYHLQVGMRRTPAMFSLSSCIPIDGRITQIEYCAQT